MSASYYFPNKSYANLEINNILTRVQIFLMASKIFGFVASIFFALSSSSKPPDVPNA
jgi:hypothetical protein